MSHIFSKKLSICQLWGLPLPEIETKLNALRSVIDDVSDEQLLEYLSLSDLNIHNALNMHFAGNTPSPKPNNNNQRNIGVSPDIEILNRNIINHNKNISINLNTTSVRNLDDDVEILNHINHASNTNNRKRKHSDSQKDSSIQQSSPKRRKLSYPTNQQLIQISSDRQIEFIEPNDIPIESDIDSNHNIQNKDIKNDSETDHIVSESEPMSSAKIDPSDPPIELESNNIPTDNHNIQNKDIKNDSEPFLSSNNPVPIPDPQCNNSMKQSEHASNTIINGIEPIPNHQETVSEKHIEIHSEKHNMNILKEEEIIEANDHDIGDKEEMDCDNEMYEEDMEIKEICITGFDKDKAIKYQEYGSILGLLITKKWSVSSTNIVISTCDLRDLTPSNPSFKVYASILSGIPVVSESFLIDCYEEKMVLDYRKYVMNYQRVKRKDLFNGLNVWFGETTLANKKLKLLLTLGNANIVENVKDIKEDWMSIMIVARNIERDEAKQLSKEFNCRIISEKWVMDSIYSHHSTSFDVYSTKKLEYNYDKNPIMAPADLNDFDFV